MVLPLAEHSVFFGAREAKPVNTNLYPGTGCVAQTLTVEHGAESVKLAMTYAGKFMRWSRS